MAKVKQESKTWFPEGHIYVIYYCDNEHGYGIEIVGEQGIDGDLVTINDFSFGHEEKDQDLAFQLFTALSETLISIEGDEEELVLFIETQIDPYYCQGLCQDDRPYLQKMIDQWVQKTGATFA